MDCASRRRHRHVRCIRRQRDPRCVLQHDGVVGSWRGGGAHECRHSGHLRRGHVAVGAKAVRAVLLASVRHERRRVPAVGTGELLLVLH